MRLFFAAVLKKKKQFSTFAAAVFLSCSLAGCTGSGALALPQSPSLAVVAPDSDTGQLQAPASSALLAAAEEIDLPAQTVEASPDELCSLVEENGFTAAVVCLSQPQQANGYIDTAKQIGLPLIFLGAQPEGSTMESYDKCWYLGTSAENEGEQLGKTLFSFWQNGKITDRNANRLLETVVVTSGSEADSRVTAALRIFENYGIYSSEPVFLVIDTSTDEDPAEMLRAQILLSGAPDLVFIADPSLASALVDVCSETGIPAAAFGEPENADTLLSGGTLLAYSRFDSASAAALAIDFADNVSRGRDATDGTGQRLDEQRCALLPIDIVMSGQTADLNNTASSESVLQENSNQGETNG